MTVRLLPEQFVDSREVEFLLSKQHDIIGVRYGGVAWIRDSQTWWDLVWDNRDRVLGSVHSHPGSYNENKVISPGPSQTDLQTWQSWEVGLGKQLLYYIATPTGLSQIQLLDHSDPMKVSMASVNKTPWWLPLLRELSYGGQNNA